MKKTTIIFDCFGVICTKPIESWFRKNLGDWEVSKVYFKDLAHRFDMGVLNEVTTAEELGTKVGRTAEQVQEEIDGFFTVDHELTDYIAELKGKGYKIGLLSNGHHLSFERKFFSKYEWFKPLFHHLVISSEVGMVKPNRDIYEHALGLFDATPEETIFIDDSQVNVDGANAVGISGVFYESLLKLKEDLKKFGI